MLEYMIPKRNRRCCQSELLIIQMICYSHVSVFQASAAPLLFLMHGNINCMLLDFFSCYYRVQADLDDPLEHLTNPKVAIKVMNIGWRWEQCGLFIYPAWGGSPARRDLTLCLPSLICQFAAPLVVRSTWISDIRAKARSFKLCWDIKMFHHVGIYDMLQTDAMSQMSF